MKYVSHVEIGGIEGLLHLPPEDLRPTPLLILCHGFTGRRDDKILLSIAGILSDLGIATFRFNFRDRLSPKLWINQEVEDIRQVVDYFASRNEDSIDPARIALLGHCLGGLVVASYLQEQSPVKSAVLMTPTFDLAETSRFMVGMRMGEWFHTGHYKFMHMGERKYFPLSVEFYKKATELSTLRELLQIVEQSLLVILDPNDSINDFERAKSCLDQHQAEHKLVTVPCRRHGFFRGQEKENCLVEIIDWLKEKL